jgi:hypothetical protein
VDDLATAVAKLVSLTTGWPTGLKDQQQRANV